jgi:predicted O-methyltransferase YrrM
MKKNTTQEHEGLHDKLNIPDKLKVLAVSEKRGEFIYKLAKKEHFKSTLEVGFGLGVSAAYIMSATQTKHIAIDPFARAGTDSKVGRENIKKLGLQKNLILYEDYSHNVLPKLATNGLILDFAFIDGDHKFDNIFVDFYYIDLMLKKNGLILFDDANMRTTQLVASFVLKNKKNYILLENPYKNFILLQKVDIKDERPWYHFEEFYNKKSMKKHAEYKKYDINNTQSVPHF